MKITKKEAGMLYKEILYLREASGGVVGLGGVIGEDVRDEIIRGVHSYNTAIDEESDVKWAKEQFNKALEGLDNKEKLRVLINFSQIIAEHGIGIGEKIVEKYSKRLDKYNDGKVDDEFLAETVKDLETLVYQLVDDGAFSFAPFKEKEELIKTCSEKSLEDVRVFIKNNDEPKIFMAAAMYKLISECKFTACGQFDLDENVTPYELGVLASSQIDIDIAEKEFAAGIINETTFKRIVKTAMKAAIVLVGLLIAKCIFDVGVLAIVSAAMYSGLICAFAVGAVFFTITGVTAENVISWSKKLMKFTDKAVDYTSDMLLAVYSIVNSWVQETVPRVKESWNKIKEYVLSIPERLEKFKEKHENSSVNANRNTVSGFEEDEESILGYETELSY